MEAIFWETTGDVMLIVDNVVQSLRAKVEQNATGKFRKALVVLEKVAKVGDVAIQHHPDVVALVWAGLRLLLQVSTSLYICLFLSYHY